MPHAVQSSRKHHGSGIKNQTPRSQRPLYAVTMVTLAHLAGCTLGFAERGDVAVWHHGVIGPSSFFCTVSLTGPIRVEWVPLIASPSTSSARSHTALQGPRCPYLLWMTLKERLRQFNLFTPCVLCPDIPSCLGELCVWFCLWKTSTHPCSYRIGSDHHGHISELSLNTVMDLWKCDC